MSTLAPFDPTVKDRAWVKAALIDIHATPYESPVVERRREWDDAVVTWTEFVGDWREQLAEGRYLDEVDTIDLHAFVPLDTLTDG